jgi:hypothetical protein
VRSDQCIISGGRTSCRRNCPDCRPGQIDQAAPD